MTAISANHSILSETVSKPSNGALWIGRIMSALSSLFLLFDGIMKLFKPEFVVKATVELGYPETVIVPLGIVLTACTVLYADSAHRGSGGHPVDRLSRRRRRDARTCRRGLV